MARARIMQVFIKIAFFSFHNLLGQAQVKKQELAILLILNVGTSVSPLSGLPAGR
jgi:hypothetical protein